MRAAVSAMLASFLLAANDAHAQPRDKDVGIRAVVGIAAGAVLGAVAGVAVAAVAGSGAHAKEAQQCREAGGCIDLVSGPDTTLRVGVIAVPVGAFGGAVAGGLIATKAFAPVGDEGE